MLAAQASHHCGRLAQHGVQDDTAGIGHRLGHGEATLRQVLHQAQVKRQLLEGQPLEQAQHIAAGRGVDEIVGVLDAARNTLQSQQFAQVESGHEARRLVKRHIGVDRHALSGRGLGAQKFRTFQTRLPVASGAPPVPSTGACEGSPVRIS